MGAPTEFRIGQVWRSKGGDQWLVGDVDHTGRVFMRCESQKLTIAPGNDPPPEWRLISDPTQPPGDDLVGRTLKADNGVIYRIERRSGPATFRLEAVDKDTAPTMRTVEHYEERFVRDRLCPAPTPESPPDGDLTGRYYATRGAVLRVIGRGETFGKTWRAEVVKQGDLFYGPGYVYGCEPDAHIRAHLCDPPEGAVGAKCEDCGAGVPPNVTPLACGDCLRKRLVAAKGQKAEAARRTEEEQRERNRASHRWNPYLVRGWVHCEDCGDSAENFGKCPTPGTRKYANGKEWDADANTEWQGWAAKQPKRPTLPTYDGPRTGMSSVGYSMRTGRRT